MSLFTELKCRNLFRIAAIDVTTALTERGRGANGLEHQPLPAQGVVSSPAGPDEGASAIHTGHRP